MGAGVLREYYSLVNLLPSVIIIGGGITGLSAAYFLEQYARARGLALDITLLEKSPRLGGVIQTEPVNVANSNVANSDAKFLCEAGPDSLLTTKPAALELCRKLGLGEQIIPSNDARRKTFVLHHGALQPLPDGLMFVVPTKIRSMFSSPLLSLTGKLRLALSPIFSPGPLPDSEDISVEQYITARFGQEVSERLAEPLLNAVYGADFRALSARAVFPQLLALEKKHGSLWKGFARQVAGREASSISSGIPAGGTPSTIFVTLRDGLARLPETVEESLQATTILQDETVISVRRVAPAGDATGKYLVASDRAERACDAVVVATPAPVAAEMVRELDAVLAGHLAEIVYHSVAIVALGYGSPSGEPPAATRPGAREWMGRGFGFVVPRGEGRETIACTWVHNKFDHRAPPGTALLRSFFGGARNAAIDQLADEQLLATAKRELQSIMGLNAEPAFHRVYRWAACMPQYSVGHLGLLSRIDARLAEHSGLHLAGNGYRGVGIPDCIQSAAQAAQKIIEQLVRGGA
ncbi:MAG: protoporphyrinogen oxidase [Acidobacteria bacterium]|nr:protoporphyrinogen oxidase [Acidobacteriota bacterium]